MKLRKIIALSVLFLVFAFTRVESARAAVSNLGTGIAIANSSVFDDGFLLANWAALSFTTGAQPSATVFGIDAEFADAVTPPDDAGFSLALFSDAAGQPGAEIATLAGSNDPQAAGLYSYTLPAPQLVGPLQTYWIVFRAEDPGTGFGTPYYEMASTDSTAEDSAFGWTIGDILLESDNFGFTWMDFGSALPRVSVIAIVPEPGRLLLFALAASMLPFRRRR